MQVMPFIGYVEYRKRYVGLIANNGKLFEDFHGAVKRTTNAHTNANA